jgi:hypothetical protein
MDEERPSDRILEPVLKDEMKAIAARRKKINPDSGEDVADDLFGIALSGGGIRSATINLGILEVLNKCGILPLADYLSTVSGGGYIGGYVHATLSKNDCPKTSKQAGKQGPYASLFLKEHIEHLKKYGYYLAPGTGLIKVFNRLRLGGGFAASFIMNLVWVLATFLSLALLLRAAYSIHVPYEHMIRYLVGASVVVLAYHYFLHPLRYVDYKLWPSNVLNYTEGVLLCFLAALSPFLLYRAYGGGCHTPLLTYAPFILLVTGFFANPNLLALHRFYRDRIAAAFMKKAGAGDAALILHELALGGDPDKWHCAPYPLINTCLNLQGAKDDKFMGTKTSDYFLLSPLYCGSKLTGFVKTNSPGFSSMTLSSAIAVSGAAVNPEMGTSTNKVLAFLMTLLNLRLGYWVINPKYGDKPFYRRFVWWPYYHIMELLSKTDTRKRRVNISDGGHIENLGVYELLRRKCKLIIAIDAGSDPEYRFSDLKNLVIRARNELGIEIDFTEGQAPEQVIAPESSLGFSKQHYVVAEIKELPGKSEGVGYTGLLVYVKASMLAGKTWKKSNDESYFYKTYHPAFPHESTADQFFDPQQWTAYYQLGKFIAGNLLGVTVENNPNYGAEVSIKSTGELCYWFDTKIREQQ